jgi:hypothetical protein
MSELTRSLITPPNDDAGFSDWWFSFGGVMCKFAMVGAAIDVINWVKAHPLELSIDNSGGFSDFVREAALEPLSCMANHGHFNTMVWPKLAMLKEFTRLNRIGVRITFSDSEMDLIAVALTTMQEFLWEKLKIQRKFNDNPNWGSANEPKWTEYL